MLPSGLVLIKCFYSLNRLNTNTNTNITITIPNRITSYAGVTYNLDSHRVINIYSLEFHDTYSSLLLTQTGNNYSLNECIDLVDKVITVLESYTSSGFLPSVDLRKFPIISELIQPFIQGETESEINDFVCGDKSMETCKWLYNIIILTLYLVCLKSLKSTEYTLENEDIVLDLKTKERELYKRLDPSIRHYIQKKGISIKQNTYIGFDTEFCKKDLEHNTLVSAQLAVTAKTYVLIPKVTGYKISKLDESSNKLIRLTNSSSVLNYSKIETSIKLSIDAIRKIRHSTHDESLLVIGESLKQIKGLNYTELEDHIIFSLPRSIIQPYIHYGSSFSMKEIIKISSGIAKPYHTTTNEVLMQLIKEIRGNNFSLKGGKDRLEAEIHKKYGGYTKIEELKVELDISTPPILESLTEDTSEKRLSREFLKDLISEQVSVTRTRGYYLIAHLTQADLSMLSDFEKLKEDLSIVNGSFVTLGKPLKYCGRNIHIRDTMLLAPGGGKSLANIGRLYGGVLNKIEISKHDLEDMQGFLARDKTKFTEYALRDALISLIHASWVEDFNFKIGGVGIPISLSALGRSYVKSVWRDESYQGYQISSKYLLGDVSTTITPKGLNVIDKIGFVLPFYTANYKGGRNECFMYGIDRDTIWYDYDLTNAYTTVMSMAGHPDYAKCRRITTEELHEMNADEILYSYLILHADFEFPAITKYPSIPCYVDENCTVYPLQGSCVITGAEYLLATAQKCKLKIHDIYFTPFKGSEYRDHKPFSTIFKTVQEQRREHPKGTISNLIYKEIGNSIYGSVVRGIGNKRKFDIKSKGTVRMFGDDLTNPLIASWTTAFIRSIVGECLHSIQDLDGLVVSVTTDGFITNLSDLERKISENYLFSMYKKIRFQLSEDDTGLELKSNGRGIIAWSTRGQIGIDSKIIATTGLQHRAFQGRLDMLAGFLATFKTDIKTVEFVQSRLRSASEIYKRGGHVTMVRRDQLFRMHFDNRRVLEWETTIPTQIECLVDSKPLRDIKHGQNLRAISKISKNKLFGKYTSGGTNERKYSRVEDVAVRNFLKGLLSTPPLFNLNRDNFYGYPSIVEYIKTYDSSIKLTCPALAVIQYRVNVDKLKWLPMERTPESDKFIQYVQLKFKAFDVEGFYGVRSKDQKK